MEKLLNVENDWDGEVDCPEVMGPHCLISEEEVAAAIKSILVPVYKGKGDPLVCGSYRAITLLEQPMKVLEKRIRCQVSIDNLQFGFMHGKGTTDAIFIMRQVQKKHQA